MRQAFFVIITKGAARLSSFKYVGHGSSGHDQYSYLTDCETPGPSPTESRTARRIRAASRRDS